MGKQTGAKTVKERLGAFDPPPGYRSDAVQDLPEINSAEFIKVVESRRSVRRFTETPVPKEILQRCIELALLSPNSCNLQPWEFIILETPALRDKINRACLSQNAARTAPSMLAIVARTDTWRQNAADMLDIWPDNPVPPAVRTAFSKNLPFQYRLGGFGLVGLYKRYIYWKQSRKHPIWRGPVTGAERREWATKTTALAAQTLMLALRAHGYDTCPIEGFDRPRAKKLLGLSKHQEIIMFMAAGHRADDGVYEQRVRLPSDRFIKVS